MLRKIDTILILYVASRAWRWW